MKTGTRVVLALDVTEEAKAMSVAESVKDLVAAIKVNWPLVLATSPQIVTRLARLAPVICDFKVADIPNTNRMIAEQVARLGASGLIVQGFSGRDSVRACVEAAKGVEVFVVTEMSHPGGTEYTGPVADRMALIAKEEGAAGIIAPATRPERIRKLRTIVGKLLILSPGVGAQGGSAAEALRNGADFVIAGRSIYQSPDPRGAAERLVEEVRRSGV
jgi:orotidine-5'-phosphate decarboxylase